MFEILLTMIAIAAQSGAGGDPQTSRASAEAPAAPAVALVAEPQTPTGKFTTATEVKPILGATRSSWVGVREFQGKDLLYVTQILSWRCGLLELKIGLNGGPLQPWPLPPCHMDQPMPGVLLPEDGMPFTSHEPGSIESVEVHLTYDDLSTESATFQRAAILMQ